MSSSDISGWDLWSLKWINKWLLIQTPLYVYFDKWKIIPIFMFINKLEGT